MAKEKQVKQYVAHWLQLGKALMVNGGQTTFKPKVVISGNQYSQEFETCWQAICAPDSGDCYLEGSDLTVAQLLTQQWDITDCGRCSMPVPLPTAGIASVDCPCHDLPSWPNDELPHPRSPVSSSDYLKGIRQRLTQSNI